MTSFLHPALLWGLALVALPVIIHLINLVRHRRVPWAAMEFLLASQKRNRTWILFKQLLLLLLRMLAVAVLVLVVAQPMLRNQWGRWLGSAPTHHFVLLDDSFSMSDRQSDGSAFNAAKAVVQQIGAEAGRQVQPQQFTLLRFSHAGRAGKAAQPDLRQQAVDTEFAEHLRERLEKTRVSETAAGPQEALAALEELLRDVGHEQPVVYLISDFRARQWDDPGEIRKQMQRLQQRQIPLWLIHCVESGHPNLAVTGLAPLEEIRAAGVPVSLEVTVQNFGSATARNVNVALEEDGRARPGVTLRQVEPGRAATERFIVNFATAGQHTVTARIEADAVAADNVRYSVVDLPVDVPVLLIDGDPSAVDARRLADVFSPGGTVRTGVNARIETPRYLSLHPLNRYHAIYMLNVDRLDHSAVSALEAYVSSGGGLGMFLGPRTAARFLNEELYKDGKGLFPLPVVGPTELAIDRLQPAPDVEVTEHPLFRLITGQRNSDISTVNVERYFAVPRNWAPPAESTVKVLARLRNKAPLVVEQRFGGGRVVAVLTSAAPTWNNWSQKGSFVAAVLNLQAYLGARPLADRSRLVGSSLALEFDPAQYRPQVRFVMPGPDAASAPAADALPTRNGLLAATLPDVEHSGYYEAHLVRNDGTSDVRRFAVNVDPVEGDLKTFSGAELMSRLEGLRFEYAQATAFQSATRDAGGTDLSRFLLYALVVLLIVEQVLAWSTSYHPPLRHRLPARGVA